MAWIYSKKMMEGYANSRYSQEQGAESLEENFLDGEQCALWNGTHMQQASWLPGKMTDVCQLSRSGMTFKFLTDDLGEDLLTWYRVDFLARTYPAQEKEQVSKEAEAVCGNTWRESSVKFDRDTLSWKTHLCLWEEVLPLSSVILPKWGMMRDGVLLERIMSPLHIEETEFGSLLPTPTCADATMGAVLNENTKFITLNSGRLRKISNQGVSGSIGLARHVQMWPTAQARDYKGSSGRSLKGTEKDLPTAVKMWPTPTCHNAKEQDSPTESTRNTPTLCHLARGGDQTQPRHLNPTWVEWLMGWPLEWTGLKPLEMDRFQQWLRLHGRSYQDQNNH